ncbi:MAG: acetyl-CoA carboxylase biotin carboxyl carrier protein subunit [Candidatus Paceibacterota bacterium]
MKIKIKDKIYDIKISEMGKGTVKVKVNGRGFIFRDKNQKEAGGCEDSDASRSSGKSLKEVRAPITGTVAKIFIKEGEDVKIGQKVLSLSAMKMENEIVSEFDGKTASIKVKAGQMVKTDELLISFE